MEWLYKGPVFAYRLEWPENEGPWEAKVELTVWPAKAGFLPNRPLMLITFAGGTQVQVEDAARLYAKAWNDSVISIISDQKAMLDDRKLPKDGANATQHGGSHYKTKAIEPWDYITANNLGFLEGSVVKYLTRWRDKNGVEDLKKAQHYIQKLIEVEENHENR